MMSAERSHNMKNIAVGKTEKNPEIISFPSSNNIFAIDPTSSM
jgi:hypothetical protein